MSGRLRLAIVLVVVLLIAAAGATFAVISHSGSGSETGSTATPGTYPTGSASTGPAPSSMPSMLSPFTGRMVTAGRPVLAVKIDNVAPARPQTGLGSADVVYVEPVEGGLSRVMAIFSSVLPARVGPVRSARESDLELLRQFGRPGLAFSGANHSVLAAVAAAPVDDLSQDEVPSAYARSATRAAPHNLYADPRTLLAHGANISAAQDIGFRFGALPAGDLGTPLASKVVRYAAASTGFTWSASRQRWEVSLDGRPASSTDGGRLEASTVVVQNVSITTSALHDVLGNRTPYTHTVGSGTATVLRDGVAVTAHWSRPSARAGTTFTTASGTPLTFAPGQVWIVYAPQK